MRSPTPDRLLEIYLADHLAASTAGVALARRSAQSNAGTALGEALRRLAAEIEDDRRTLQAIVAKLGFRESKAKDAVARSGEVGRMKLNGQLRGYSPLSRVLELEALSVGVAGKLALWQSLQSVPAVSARLPDCDLDQLAERARRQRAEIEEHRIEAARETFSSPMNQRHVASMQAAFYVGTGVWPLLHRRSFERVTGRKTDFWLAQTVGLTVTTIGIGLAHAVARRRGAPPELRTVAATSAAGLALVDFSFVARGRISKIYLADAAAEVALVAGWLFVRDRPDPDLPDTSPGDIRGPGRTDAARQARPRSKPTPSRARAHTPGARHHPVAMAMMMGPGSTPPPAAAHLCARLKHLG